MLDSNPGTQPLHLDVKSSETWCREMVSTVRWANAFHSIMTHCGPGLTILQPGKNNCHIGTLHTTLTDSLLLLLPPPLYTVVNNEHVFFSSFYTLLALWLSVKRVLFLDAKVTIEI